MPDHMFKLKWITRAVVLAITGFLLIFSLKVSADSTKLVSMPDYGDVIDFEITSDGRYVVFTADQDTDENPELYSIPTAGGTAVKLNNVEPDSGVNGFLVSPDGARVVYVLDNDLYSVPVEGPKSASVKLHDNGVMISSVYISPDNRQVVYPVKESIFTARELYSIPIGGGERVRLNKELVEDGSIDCYYILISPDSKYVVYRADQDTFAVEELYSVPIEGPASVGVKLNDPLPVGGDVAFKKFTVSPDSSRVVYIADQETDEVDEIYSVPITGSSTANIKLNGPLPSGGDIDSFKISRDSRSVIYRADQDRNDIMELYNVPIKGGEPVKLNHEMEIERGSIGDDVHAFELSPDGKTVVFEASWVNHIQNYPDFGNIFSFNVYELFSIAIDDPLSEEIELWTPSEKAGYGSGERYVSEVVLHAANHPICEINFNRRGDTVVYRSEYPNAGYCVLWRVPVDGSSQAGQLYSADDASYPEVKAYQVTKDDSKVVYTMAYDVDLTAITHQSLTTPSKLAETRLTKLFSVPITCPGESSQKINGPLVEGGSVTHWDLSPNSREAVYKADQDTLDIQELYLTDLGDCYLYIPLILQE